ncbi:hypothetical protein K1T71_004003 [Dendrolimus kikuchii]|uniref:Uncharacterized protein n=1 Tax=Dendrolimus kikuchii TaxID=765133 RepID=A0ACC1D9K0_9NEOP|nr:hypothetical protein K1T71_004003 [Dendrolimus kikuchii]
MYFVVIDPIVTYAASAWHYATMLQTVRNRLETLQRCFALKICKAYRMSLLTSVTVLSGTLLVDLKIRVSALLFQAKKGNSADFLPQDGTMQQKVSHLDLSHPAELIKTEFEFLENLESETVKSQNLAEAFIYTDGSKIVGQVAAAFTWWDQNKETSNSTLNLHPSCTVFQSELYALLKAVNIVKDNSETIFNIMNDMQSALELLSNPKPYHHLAKQTQECIRDISAEGRRECLFWIRANIDKAGKQRADELAKQGAPWDQITAIYHKLPVSFVKRKIRQKSVRI